MTGPRGWKKSLVTDEDLEAAERNWGYAFPEDFKEFLKSYILPAPTVVYGKFFSEFSDDWPGGGMTYSHELGRYLSWEEIPEELMGEFSDCLMFLECASGEIVYVDHDFYTMSNQSELENIKAYKQLLFKSFSDLLRCLFLGAVCNAETAEMRPDELHQI